ncbi:MAG: hypothetical protein FJ386_00845 [Verrucomicrobia bacterium]|nr:hypothetical protein [Verrucomicrobiota bacterium]
MKTTSFALFAASIIATAPTSTAQERARDGEREKPAPDKVARGREEARREGAPRRDAAPREGERGGDLAAQVNELRAEIAEMRRAMAEMRRLLEEKKR